MVKIATPPPTRRPNPIFHTLPAGSSLVRLFDPTRFGVTATTFRNFGPLLRFDHQIPDNENKPTLDETRGVYYTAFTLSSCVVEVFGDTGLIRGGEWHVAMPRLTRDLRLLDLRGRGAMRAGSVAAIAKTADRSDSQRWSRHFYEASEYGQPDGLIWPNAHNDEVAILLYERAKDALRCPPSQVMRLDAPELEDTLLLIARDNQLVLVP